MQFQSMALMHSHEMFQNWYHQTHYRFSTPCDNMSASKIDREARRKRAHSLHDVSVKVSIQVIALRRAMRICSKSISLNYRLTVSTLPYLIPSSTYPCIKQQDKATLRILVFGCNMSHIEETPEKGLA